MASVVNLEDKFSQFTESWQPKIVGEVNDCQVRIVRLDGEFVWHAHEAEDEMFFVLEGVLRMEFRDRTERIGPGEFIIVPRGVEHRPVANEGQVKCMLFEPSTVLNTGDAPASERTVEEPERL